MLKLTLLKSFSLTLGIFLFALTGSIANGWLLLSVWLIFIACRLSYLSIENIRKKLNTKNFLNIVMLPIIGGVFHTELKFKYLNTISSYRIIQIKKIVFTGLVGAIICILNVLSKGMWASDFMSILQQRPFESVTYLLLISLIFSLLDNKEEKELKNINEWNITPPSNEVLPNIIDKLNKLELVQWLIWILIVILTIFVIKSAAQMVY